jgi:hypothetical protein
VGLFEQPALAFEEGDGSVPIVFDGFDLDFATTHVGDFVCTRSRAMAH